MCNFYIVTQSTLLDRGLDQGPMMATCLILWGKHTTHLYHHSAPALRLRKKNVPKCNMLPLDDSRSMSLCNFSVAVKSLQSHRATKLAPLFISQKRLPLVFFCLFSGKSYSVYPVVERLRRFIRFSEKD